MEHEKLSKEFFGGTYLPDAKDIKVSSDFLCLSNRKLSLEKIYFIKRLSLKLKKMVLVQQLLAVAAFGLAACSSSTSKTLSQQTITNSDCKKLVWWAQHRGSTLEQGSKKYDKDKAGVKLEFTQFTDLSLTKQFNDGDAWTLPTLLQAKKNWNKENNLIWCL